MITYIKHTPRGALLAIFSETKNNYHEVTITNPKGSFFTTKRLKNKSTSVNFQENFRKMGWKFQG